MFIDDLSFSANDDNFAALKAILEGSVGGRSQNVVVYATSNRRHLIKETLSDRSACTFATPFTLRNAAISPFDRPAVDSTWTSCRPCASKKRSVLRNASRQPA